MLAHHPETGQPIRILRSDAQISQDNKTLVWIQPTFVASPRWSRWSTLVSDPAALGVLANHGEPTCCVVTTMDPAWIPIVTRSSSAESQTIVVATRAVQSWLTLQGVNTEHVLGIYELFDLYPYLGEPVRDTDPIAKVVVSLAHVLRHSRIAWAIEEDATDSFGMRAQLTAWRRHMESVGGGGLLQLPPAASDAVVPECWLIQQYFKHPLPRRSREIWGTLERNIHNPYIDRILLLNETADLELPKSEKLLVKVQPNRLTYADVLRAIQKELPEGAIAVFSNSDIWFDETLKVLWSIRLEEQRLFLALLRWEEREGETPTLFGPRADSQDSWIVAKRTVDFEVKDDDFGFPFGKPGCDNAITVAMLRRKCLVVNPAYTIHTHHQHASNIRNYNPRDCLYKPAYLYVDPTVIHPIAIENGEAGWICKELSAPWKATAPTVSFTRQLHPVHEAAGRTICTMLNRRDVGAIWSVDGPNRWTPDPAPQALYEWKGGMFVTPDGLVSSPTKIMVGSHRGWREGWEKASISTMTPALHIPAMVSLTHPTTDWMSLSNWVLTQLPTVLRVQDVLRTKDDELRPEFMVPSLDSVAPFLYDCVWNAGHVGTFPYMTNTQYYTDHLLSVAPAASTQHVTREDVVRLRRLLPRAQTSESGPVLVLCVSNRDGAVCTPGWAEEVQACHGEQLLKGWTVHVIQDSDSPKKRREAFQSAAWIVGERGDLEWLWMARPDTRIVECMRENAIDDTILHLAGAAGCFYIPLLMPSKEPVEFQRERALVDVGRALKMFGFQTLLKAKLPRTEDLPLIIVPTGQDGTMWAHSGDSFREMVDVWVARGYCQREYTTNTGLCWWGGVGDTVLFDWDTPRWWNIQIPNYRFALFGNAVPPGPTGHEGRQSVWSMWPRHPQLLETFVAEQGVQSWGNRPLSSLFLGKVENGVQKEHRCGQDWSSAVELFSMPLDSTGGPYPYTPRAYLEQVAKSRFGLCLRGYGPKCNREIEYMALGTVPIITDGVDMTHFLSPPREGVHFLRAKTPADVQRIVAQTPQDVWERMSAACHAWWRENASAEGLFRLTWARIEQCRPYLTAGILPAWPVWKSPHH